MGDVDWHVRVDVDRALRLVRFFFPYNPIPIFFKNSFLFIDGEGSLREVRFFFGQSDSYFF